jgi:2-iminobutanoate/2-iminopropanoate deaminase
VEEETRHTLDNVRILLQDAGSGLEHVVKVTAYLVDMNQFGAFNAVYKEYFPADYPARTTIQAARLPLDTQVEIDVIALIPGA